MPHVIHAPSSCGFALLHHCGAPPLLGLHPGTQVASVPHPSAFASSIEPSWPYAHSAVADDGRRMTPPSRLNVGMVALRCLRLP